MTSTRTGARPSALSLAEYGPTVVGEDCGFAVSQDLETPLFRVGRVPLRVSVRPETRIRYHACLMPEARKPERSRCRHGAQPARLGHEGGAAFGRTEPEIGRGPWRSARAAP